MYLGIAWRGKGDIPSLRNFISLISALKANCQCCVPISPSLFSLSLFLDQVFRGTTFLLSSPLILLSISSTEYSSCLSTLEKCC